MARKPKEINWDIVQKQIEAGLNAKQIAHGKINICHFYRRFKQHFKCDFANYASQGYECGDGLLKFTQYMKAIAGKTKELDKLCDIRLGQSAFRQEVPANDELNDLRHQNMILKNELQQIKEMLNANKPQAG